MWCLQKKKKNFFFWEQKSVKSNRKSIWWCVSLGKLLFTISPKIGESKKKRVSSSDLFSVVQIRKKTFILLFFFICAYTSAKWGADDEISFVDSFPFTNKKKKVFWSLTCRFYSQIPANVGHFGQTGHWNWKTNRRRNSQKIWLRRRLSCRTP